MLLTVEWDERQEAVELFCDREGLDFLIQKLGQLDQGGNHDHFMTPAWGGSELTEEKQGSQNKLINHLKVILLRD